VHSKEDKTWLPQAGTRKNNDCVEMRLNLFYIPTPRIMTKTLMKQMWRRVTNRTTPNFTPTSNPRGVQMGRVTGQMNKGAQDHTSDKRSDEDDQMTPSPLASEGVPK
jgi:hypothetical protein